MFKSFALLLWFGSSASYSRAVPRALRGSAVQLLEPARFSGGMPPGGELSQYVVRGSHPYLVNLGLP